MGHRIGLGRDLHRLVAGRRFLLGGIEIPHETGESGVSDGDVLVHAIIDAMLGAAACGDIGEMFPPSDKSYQDISSMKLLDDVNKKIKYAGYKIVNIDCVVSCEKPAVLPYRKLICQNLERALQLESGSVFVKGKTGEGIGDIGEGRAVEALAVCLLQSP
ncbi:MAG: 2-C-methyl-D-erythritol 2,4-cyclodiphosphate synthase [Termitinemataceae bacterium]|nr:MAG: 2-C-methyl-D-erythritol 2,4-cyclodiphosphate synthase [Termitinemataceae bacterium]